MYLPDHLSSHSRSDISTKLFRDAERAADSMAVWRKVDSKHAASLVMFHELLATRDRNDEEAPSYLAAAAHQLRTLARKEPDVVYGAPGAGFSGLAWSSAIVDVLSAAERGTKPCL